MPEPPPVATMCTSPKDPSATVPDLPPPFRDYTPSHLSSISADTEAPVRKSSRLKNEEVYDFNAPVVLHEYIEEKGMALDEVLLAFGFTLCDDDSLW